MMEQIRHRGEDAYFNENRFFANCAISTNRLAIVDEEQGKQPKTSSNCHLHAIMNGEIYNFRELKIELENKGYKFQTNNDTEVLVNAFQEWGEGCLNKLDGIFSFVIYNSQKNTIFAARDPIGVKPLYYAYNDIGEFYVASEIKQLAALKDVTKIECLEPGHYIQNGEIKSYYTVVTGQTGIDNLDEKTLASQIRDLLDAAVKKRIPDNIPVGIFLSGGIDSSAVLALALKYTKNIIAIIGGNSESHDRKFALRLCNDLNIPYEICEPPSELEMSKSLPEIVKLAESFEPNVVRQSSVYLHFCKLAKKLGLKVVLCGEGADELFGGYPEFAKVHSESDSRRLTVNFLKDLHRTQLQRVDRCGMAETLEIREPFLDKRLVELALRLPHAMKVKRNADDVALISKHILREALVDVLPDYIVRRPKVVLSEGAGFGGNQPQGGMFCKVRFLETSKTSAADERAWNLRSAEERKYFQSFQSLGYDKAEFSRQRVTANGINTVCA